MRDKIKTALGSTVAEVPTEEIAKDDINSIKAQLEAIILICNNLKTKFSEVDSITLTNLDTNIGTTTGKVDELRNNVETLKQSLIALADKKSYIIPKIIDKNTENALNTNEIPVEVVTLSPTANLQPLYDGIQEGFNKHEFYVEHIRPASGIKADGIVDKISQQIKSMTYEVNKLQLTSTRSIRTNIIGVIQQQLDENEFKIKNVGAEFKTNVNEVITNITTLNGQVDESVSRFNLLNAVKLDNLLQQVNTVSETMNTLSESSKSIKGNVSQVFSELSVPEESSKNLKAYSTNLKAVKKSISKFFEASEVWLKKGTAITAGLQIRSLSSDITELAEAINKLFYALNAIEGLEGVVKDFKKTFSSKPKKNKTSTAATNDNKSGEKAVQEANTKYDEAVEAIREKVEQTVADNEDLELSRVLRQIVNGNVKGRTNKLLQGSTINDESKAVLKNALGEYDKIVEEIEKGSYQGTEAADKWREAQQILVNSINTVFDSRHAEKNVTKLENLSSRINNLLANNSKVGSSQIGQDLKDLNSEIRLLVQQIPDDQTTNNAIQKFEHLRSLMYETGVSGKSNLQKIGATISATFRRVFAGDVTYRLLMKIREVPTIVREIDSAMTDLKRVTSETANTYDQFLTSATQKAAKLGATVTETIKATSSFGRLGYNLEEASTLAESALIYKNVGWLDIETATNDIVSAMKAFNLTAEDSLRIVDTFNILGNKFALTSADVGSGLKTSASALATANNTLEESAAMITAITEITQDASSAGNALKTLSLRIRSTKAELTEMGEDAEGAVATTAKLRKQIQGITGVDILDKNGDFKSTYEIMKGIAGVWKDLSDTEQASVLESLAGKVRANQVAALLNNWSQAEKALDESLNSSGTALKENDVYLKSAEGRLSQLKATAQDLSLDVFNSDELKTFLKLANDLLKVFSGLKDAALPVLTSLALTGTSIKNPDSGIGMSIVRMFSNSNNRLLEYNNGGLFDFSSIDRAMAGSEYQVATDGWREQLRSVTAEMEGLTVAQQRLVATRYENIVAGKAENLTMKELGVATAAETAKTIGLTIAKTALNAAIGLGIGLLTQVVVSLITQWVQAEEKAAQATLEASDALKSQLNDIDNYKTKITELKTALDDSNISQQDAYEKRKELLQIQDEIIDKYGLEKGSIDLLNKSLEENIGLLDAQSKSDIKKNYRENKSEVEEANEKLNTREMRVFDTYVGDLRNNEEVKAILDKYGYKIDEEQSMIITNAKTLYEQYNDLNSVIRDLSNDAKLNDNEDVDKFVEYLSSEVDGIGDDKFKDYVRILNEYALGEIYSNNIYNEFYELLTNDVKDYQKAVAEGNQEAIAEAIRKATHDWNISKYSDYLGQEENFAIRDVFEGLYNQIFSDTHENYKATLDEETRQRLTELFGKYNNTELKTKNQLGVSFQMISDEAEKAGMAYEELVDVLAELGIIQEDLTVKTEKATPFKVLVEQVEETQKALTNFDNAIAKMSSSDESSAFLTADELNTLIEYDSTLIDEVEKTAKGYVISTDKLVEARKNYFKNERETLEAEITESEDKIEEYKETLELLEKQRNDSNKTEIDKKVKNVSDQIATLEKNVKNYKLVLSELQAPLIDFRSSLSSITSKAESLTSSITEMSSQQRQFGYVTDKTAASFIASNDNWQDFIELADNGKYILKENADGYKDLIAKSTGYNNVLSALEIQQDELNRQTLYLKGSIIGLSKTGQVGADDIGKLKTQLEESETALSETSVQVETLKMVLEALDRTMKSSDGLNKFNDRIKDLKYQLDMGLISQAQYNASYDSALATFSTVATKEDKDSVRDAEVTSRQQHIQQATTDFEKAENALNTAYEQGNISLQEKLEQRKKLIEQYYGTGTLLGGTEEGRQKYQELLNDLYNMEIEIAKKSYDDRKKLIERNREDNIYNIDQEIEELKKLNEEYYNPETGALGKTREAVDDKIYEENLREIESKSKEAYDYWIAEAERARKMGIITEQQLWDEKLRLANKYLKNIKQFEDEYRDAMDDYAIAGQQAMYDEELRLLENSHSLKLKTDKQYWTERHALAEKYYKNNAAFEKEWMAEQTAYQTEGMRAMYEEDLKESERAYKRGDILLSTHIQNRKNLWETYYKGKAELREEDLQAQEEIKDLYTSGLQGQISALEAFKSAETQQLNDEIELLREEQSERERIAQEQEKVIDKQIRALQRQQEAIERKKKVEEEDYELQKAILNLQKASMGTRLVYTSGGWTLKRDEQKYQDALKEVDEKKQDAQNKQLEKQIEALQSQKQAISDATSAITDKIDEEITERELAIKRIEAPFDNLIKILTTVATKMTMENVDPALLNMILSSESGQEAIAAYKARMEFSKNSINEHSKIGDKETDEFYSYWKNTPKSQQVLSKADWTAATRAVFNATKDTNTSSNTKKLLNDFNISLEKMDMTYEELEQWAEKLAKSENMTSEQWAKKYGLADLFGIDATAGGKNTEQLFGGEDQWKRKENTPEKLGQLLTEAADDITNAADEIAEEENMQSVTDGVTATATNTSEILKIIQSFNAANPHLFTGTQGSKVSTTESVKQDATQIIENVSNTATFNINVEGNADTKTLTAMRTELGKAFNEYTEALTGALSIAHQRQLTT